MPRKALGRVGLIAVLFSLSIAPVNTAHAATERAYIGTYTPEPGSSQTQSHGEGIYLVSLDTTTGALSNPRLVAKTRSPSWIALSPDGKTLVYCSDKDAKERYEFNIFTAKWEM